MEQQQQPRASSDGGAPSGDPGTAGAAAAAAAKKKKELLTRIASRLEDQLAQVKEVLAHEAELNARARVRGRRRTARARRRRRTALLSRAKRCCICCARNRSLTRYTSFPIGWQHCSRWNHRNSIRNYIRDTRKHIRWRNT